VVQHMAFTIWAGANFSTNSTAAPDTPVFDRVVPQSTSALAQLRQVDVDEVLLVEQIRLQLQALIQLRQQQLPMNPKAAEAPLLW